MSDIRIPDLEPQPFPYTHNGSSTSSRTRIRRRLSSRNSTVSHAGSEASQSEIHSPLPRRHHLLQQSEAQLWLRSPSPVSSRAVSPPGSLSHGPMLSFSSLSAKSSTPMPAAEEPRGWARQWIRWMHRGGMRARVVPLSILGTVLLKWLIGLGGYSGRGTPPMYGDYEAQRHWMEITIHLPVRKWYTYDLQYWGLDYPPLTAYHAWACGKIAAWFNDIWVSLDTSRGIETPSSKTFMRATVLVSDLLVYIPATLLFVRTFLRHRSGRTRHAALLTILLQPALILIDSGHFQYNGVMLGFALLALNSLAWSFDLTAAIFFVFSLCYKQMALYYAPAIGSFFLGKCLYLEPRFGRKLFIRLACTTLLTFAAVFLPWLDPWSIRDPISRIFPFNRGIFEDKVANFWCASDVIVKWRRRLGTQNLIRLSMGMTAAGFTPAVWGLIYVAWNARSRSNGGEGQVIMRTTPPSLVLLLYALLTSALSFFLFSFQVHEKTILLPLLPATLLLAGGEGGSGREDWEWGVLFNNVAVFSMWPLLKKDGLATQYIAISVLWNRAIGYNPLALKSGWFVHVLSISAYAGIFALHVAEAIVKPPARYPDLFPVLNVLISASVFGCMWLWSIKRLVEVGREITQLHSKGRDRRISSRARTTSTSKRSTHG